MIQASVEDVDKLLILYNGDVNAGDFAGTEFTEMPQNNPSVSVTNNAANELNVFFAAPLDSPETVQYSGSVPNVMNPQVLSI